jgi:hypothetical protein
MPIIAAVVQPNHKDFQIHSTSKYVNALKLTAGSAVTTGPM